MLCWNAGPWDCAHHFGIFWQFNPFRRSMKAVGIYVKKMKRIIQPTVGGICIYLPLGRLSPKASTSSTIKGPHQSKMECGNCKHAIWCYLWCYMICEFTCAPVASKLAQPIGSQRFPANCQRLIQEATLVSPFGNSWDSSQKQPEPESEDPRRPRYHLSQSAPADARCCIFWLKNHPCNAEEQSTILLDCTSEIHRFRIPNLDLDKYDKSHQLWGLVYFP